MSEAAERLERTLRELREELHELKELDGAARQMLEAAVDEIDAALESRQPDQLESDTVVARLKASVKQFEESHPTLANIVGNLVDALGQMGI